MPECQNCGTHLSKQYARVFSQGDNGVEHCMYCPETPKTHHKKDD